MLKSQLKISRIIVPVALVLGILSSTVARTHQSSNKVFLPSEIVSPLR